jgi:predicted molibdopterin-dependent oxidoreductase YjgC
MSVKIVFDGQVLEVDSGITLAAVLAGQPVRLSIGGEWRAPLCGMGVCFECRLTIDGQRHQRSCQVIVRDGMRVQHEG